VHEKTQVAAARGERPGSGGQSDALPEHQYLATTTADDSTGLDRAAIPIGTGLQGITDRPAAHSGNIDFTYPRPGFREGRWVTITRTWSALTGNRAWSRAGPVRQMSPRDDMRVCEPSSAP
jgi:hypothetical protein